MKTRAVNCFRNFDVDESELTDPLADQLAEVRRHIESALWVMARTAALAPKLAGLPQAEQGRRLEAELAALSKQCDEIWGPP
jgi:hypothetical protein